MCKLLAMLLGPTTVLLLIVATIPEGMKWNLPLALAAYVLAHVLFWPVWLATNALAKRLRIQTLLGMGFLMAVASIVIWLPAAVIDLSLQHDPEYGWKAEFPAKRRNTSDDNL